MLVGLRISSADERRSADPQPDAFIAVDVDDRHLSGRPASN
jgi:hypothetical protein